MQLLRLLRACAFHWREAQMRHYIVAALVPYTLTFDAAFSIYGQHGLFHIYFAAALTKYYRYT